MRWPSSGVACVDGDLVLERESETSLFRQGMGPQLLHKMWTGPLKVDKVVFIKMSAAIVMKPRKSRTRTVSMAFLKLFFRRSAELRHPIEDEFERIAWGAYLSSGRLGRSNPHADAERPGGNGGSLWRSSLAL